MLRKPAISLLLVLVAVGGAACSKGAGGTVQADGTSTTASGPAPTTTTTPPPERPLTGRARAAVLQPGDFPDGWKAVPESDGGGLSIETVWDELTRCMGVDDAAQREAIASSPTFSRGLATQARSTVEYTSQSSATAMAAALDGPKFAGCAKDAFNADAKRSAPEGATPGPAAVAPLPVTTPPGPKTYSYRINVTMNLGELQIPLFQDFLVVFNKGTVVRMLFLNPGSDFPPDLERSLVADVLARA
jgi:hypothetical protein